MKYYIKGEPGYMKNKKLKLMTGSIVGFLLIFAIYLTGYLIFGTPKNYVTILAVVVVLPTTKIFVQYLMVPWKNNANLDVLKRMNSEYAPLKVYCELIITAQEKTFEILYLLIDKDENIVAYTTKEKNDTDKFEKGVTNFLNYYEYNANVKLFTDFNQFEKRCKQLSARNQDITAEQKEHIAEVFEKVSIMSM